MATLTHLEQPDRLEESDVRSCYHLSLSELCRRLDRTHHARLREELPRIGMLLYWTAEGHGDKHPELNRALELFSLFAGDLKQHMKEEETVLFPLIEDLEAGATYSGRLLPLLERLEDEHAHADEALRELRQLTHDFTPPADACATYRLVLAALRDLEWELQEQVGIEDNILFPRASQLEQSQYAETA